MHCESDGEEEKAGVKRARNGGLLTERVPERSNGSSEGEGGRTLERSTSGGSLLTLVVGRLRREEALRLRGLGVARGVRMISRGGVDLEGVRIALGEPREVLRGWRGRNGWRRGPLLSVLLWTSSASLVVADRRGRRGRMFVSKP